MLLFKSKIILDPLNLDLFSIFIFRNDISKNVKVCVLNWLSSKISWFYSAYINANIKVITRIKKIQCEYCSYQHKITLICIHQY